MVDVIITCQSWRSKIFHRFRVYANTRPTGSTRWPQKLHPAINKGHSEIYSYLQVKSFAFSTQGRVARSQQVLVIVSKF